MNLTRLARVAQQSQSRARITAAGALVILLALIFASIALIISQREAKALAESTSTMKEQVAALEIRDAEAQEQGAAARQALAEKSQLIEKLERLAMESLGYQQVGQVDREALAMILAVRDQIDRLTRDGGERPRGVTVQYYPADFERHFNKNLILPRLDQYGFRLEKVGTRVSEAPVNAVWCGMGVDPDDVRLVVFTLMASGVKVKAVRQYREPHKKNNHVILIGVDPDLNDAPALDVERIIAMGDFRRQEEGPE